MTAPSSDKTEPVAAVVPRFALAVQSELTLCAPTPWQSTRDQLRQHHESRRRQYGLADRARRLGWNEPVMVDDDLGRSGGGSARPGFERLLVAICEGRVGIVLAVEASRLARNGRDWHTLLEFCGLVNCLLADEAAVYDPRLPNDRLLLGMQGTFSEMELSLLRQRSLEALRQKARRGELFLGVAVGYVKVQHDRITKDPDRRVQEAIGLVFRKFAALQSIRQVHLWLRQEDVRLPAVEDNGDGRHVVWKPPVYGTIRKLLTNPIYGGAYAFGRTGSRITVENGRKRVRRGLYRAREQWDVLIVDHHEGYVSWAEYERNQRVIADNATRVGTVARGAVRRGDGLLAGLLRCGHCGRRLHVSYSGNQGVCVRYSCRGAHINHGTRSCIAFGGVRVDAAVATEMLRLLQPLGIEAAPRGGSDARTRARRNAPPGGTGADPGAVRSGSGAPPVRRRRPGEPAGGRRARMPMERSARRRATTGREARRSDGCPPRGAVVGRAGAAAGARQ